MGVVASDVERRSTGSLEIATFRLACYEKKDKSFFIGVTVFGKDADYVAKTVSRRDVVAVSGRLTIDEWTDKSGQKRETAKIIANNVHAAPKPEQQKNEEVSFVEKPKSQARPSFDDEVPF